MRGSVLSLTAPARGLIVLLFTVTVVQGQNDWGVTYTSAHICAVKGTTVQISCTYTYPSSRYTVQKEFWFTKESNNVHVDLKTDPEYSNRVEYHCGNNKCTLTIRDLRESDSAEYKFRFTTNKPDGKYTGSPGVTLSVTDLQVQVTRSAVYYNTKSAELKCQSRCPLPDNLSYIWYKNEQIIRGQTSNYYLDNWDLTSSISCAVAGHENSRSPSVVVKDVWGVTYSSTQMCAFKGSTVEISCTYRYPETIDNHHTTVQKTFWFTKIENNEPVDMKTDPAYRGRVQYHCGNNNCTLRITDLTERDSAEYKFRFITNHETGRYTGSPGVTLTVTDPQLQIHVRRSAVNPDSTWTELTCHSSCQIPDQTSYIWNRNGNKLKEEEKQYFLLDTFDSADSYSCAVKGHEGFPSPSVYAPQLPSVSVSPSAEIVEGSSVTLTCSSDANPAADYTWYKKDDPKPLSKVSQLIFSSVQSSHSGEYYCTAENSLQKKTSTGIKIDVKYAPRFLNVSVSPSAGIVEGSSVTLTCSSDANPAADYTWYKNNKALPERKDVYQFISISSEDSGNYFCMSENLYGQTNSTSLSIDVQYAPRFPSVSVSPSAEIVEGSSVTLTCSSDANPAADYTWYKKDDPKPLSNVSQLIFSSVQSSHSGEYYCTAENSLQKKTSTGIKIDVTYAPKLPSVSVSPSAEIVEGSSVTLTCSSDANPAADYTWYKEDEDSSKVSGQNFTITNIKYGHSGSYYCVVQNKRGRHNSTLQLTVLPGSLTLGLIGTSLVVFLAILFFLVFLLLRKKRSSEPSPEPEETSDNNEQSLPSHLEEQEELHYASVHFLKKQTDPIYYNFSSAAPCRQKQEEDESVEYAAVKIKSATSDTRTRGQETEEDPSALYSTVNKV